MQIYFCTRQVRFEEKNHPILWDFFESSERVRKQQVFKTVITLVVVFLCNKIRPKRETFYGPNFSFLLRTDFRMIFVRFSYVQIFVRRDFRTQRFSYQPNLRRFLSLILLYTIGVYFKAYEFIFASIRLSPKSIWEFRNFEIPNGSLLIDQLKKL